MDSLPYLPAMEKPVDLDIQSFANGMVTLDITDYGPILDFVRVQSSLLD